MLHILLLIVKIIGIILGVLLGVILSGILLALFVPVRYSVEAVRTEGEGNPPVEVKAKISWLLHLINIRICYPSEVWLRARILFITVFRMPKKQTAKKDIRSEKKKKTAKSAEKTQNNEKAETAEKTEQTENTEKKTAAKEQKSEDRREDSRIEETESAKTEAEPSEDKPDKDLLKSEESESPKKKKKRRRLKFSPKELWIKICKFFQNIWYTITGICDRIKTIWENLEYYLGILRSDTFKESYELCKEELHSIFSYIRPRKSQADLVVGLDDPASTAKILSYYGILYPLVGNHVNIIPDFDRKRMEGTVFIKGKIKMFTFIKAAVRIYFNKDVKRLIKLFMKEDV